MRDNILDSVVEDLFSLIPLIDNSIRRTLRKTMQEIFTEDILPYHFMIMKILEDEGTLHIAEIGEKLKIHPPQMTRLIDHLVNKNLVEREIDTTDRRTINISLTGKGKSMIREHDGMIKGAIKANLFSLSNEEIEELMVSLKKLREIFSKLQ